MSTTSNGPFHRGFAVILLCVCAMLSWAAAAKDGVIEINGAVQARPAPGLIGNWTVATRQFRTDSSTLFKQQLGPAVIGAIVEIKGTAQADGSVLATSLEVTQAAGGAPGQPPSANAGELTGAVQALPASGLIGKWQVANVLVIVLASTRLDVEHGGVAIGTTVEVHGTANADGSITASDVEVKAGGSANPPVAGGELEIHGTIDALPASGFNGTWTISGIDVVVDASTVLDAEHVAFAKGVAVEAHVQNSKSGVLVAIRVESRSGTGANVAGSRFWGTIAALPATGLTGIWRVGGTLVDVTAATEIHNANGPVVVGAIVEVSGFAQPDGVVLAREIETRAAVGVFPGQATSAVEYRNTRLNHYFLTASAAEIALLDAGAFGGEWQRTGESFKVGGTQAVCRFYGMPPRGPDSHFFTASETECEHVMVEYAAWTFEDHVFAITPVLPSGACPAGLVEVHRFFNLPKTGADMNHRYATSSSVIAEMTGLGWAHEGVVMCAPT